MLSINMGKNTSLFMVFFLILGYQVMIISSATSSTDLDKEKQECATQLVGLATCLPYVGGTAKAPTPDCCTGLKQVLAKNKKCLCVLVKDRDDPALGLKINATLALGLPGICKAPADISECPKLLNLAPNSPDAKVFQEFGKGSTTTTSSPATTENPKTSPAGVASAQEKSEGGGKKMMVFGVEMVGGIFLWCFISLFISGFFV